MQKNCVVTAFQLFAMLYISRMIINVTYNTYTSPSGDMTDYIISALVAIPVTILIALPVYYAYKLDNKKNILDNSIDLFGGFGKIIVALFGIYFIGVCIYNFSFYNNFVVNVIEPKTSVILVGVAIMLCAIYGAFKGLKALAGISGIILTIFVSGFILIICSMMGYNKDYNFTPFFYQGNASFINGLKIMVEHASPIAVLAVLLPFVTGKIKTGATICVFGIYLTLVGVLIAVIGVMGDGLKTQIYALFAYSGLTQIGIIKRLDSIYVAIWTSGLFIKLSLYLYCFSLCMEKLFGEKKAKILLVLTAGLVLIISLIITSNENVYLLIKNEVVLFIISVLMNFVIPLMILVVKKLKSLKISKGIVKA